MSGSPTITSLEFKCLSGTPDGAHLYEKGNVSASPVAEGVIQELLDAADRRTGRWIAFFTGLEDEDVDGDYLLVVRNGTTPLVNEIYSIPESAIGELIQPWSELKPTSSAGSGVFPVPLTIKKTDGTPVPDCEVVLTTSSTSVTTGIVNNATTNGSGVVQFNLNAGTYYGWRQKSGDNFTDPFTLVVSDTGVVTIS